MSYAHIVYLRKFRILLLALIFICNVSPIFTQCEKVTYTPSTQKIVPKKNGPRILIVQLFYSVGGIRKNTIALYKGLLGIQCNVSILVAQSPIYFDLLQENLPMYVLEGDRNVYYSCKNKIYAKSLFKALLDIHKINKIDIIHVNLAGHISKKMLSVFKKATKKIKAKIILQLHDYSLPDATKFKGIDALASTSPHVIEYLKQENMRLNLGIKPFNIVFTPPIARDDTFNHFATRYKDRSDFFEHALGIKPGKSPVLSTIANIFNCKNHSLVLDAAYTLIYKKMIPIHLVFAGSGNQRLLTHLKQKTALLKLDKFVHFIGFFNEIAELLYYSDIKVLPSKGEAFSIAVLEAALMKKPIIISDAVGCAHQLIFHGQTGLIFKSEDLNDLVAQIKLLLDNKNYATLLGQAAYAYVQNNFTSKKSLSYYEHLYQQVLLTKTRKR
jgi:glycosyltransferase involved in cell wall biosynthesis